MIIHFGYHQWQFRVNEANILNHKNCYFPLISINLDCICSNIGLLVFLLSNKISKDICHLPLFGSEDEIATWETGKVKYSSTFHQCLDRHLNSRYVVFRSACQELNTTGCSWSQPVFGVFCEMILTDTWQPNTRFGSHGTNTEKSTPPSDMLTFMLAWEKCTQSFLLSDKLISHMSVSYESRRTRFAVSSLQEFYCCFLYQTIIF